MVTIVCCYNNKTMFEVFITASLNLQKTKYELIGIDNRNSIFPSISSAYNSIIPEITGSVVLFCHQDIAFSDPGFLEGIEYFICSHENDILGFCGIKDNGIVVSNLKYRETGEFITKNQLTTCSEVETVDECCFAISLRRLKALGGFNEELCDNWHLYTVELCIRNQLVNGKSIVSPNSIYHKMNDTGGLDVDDNFLLNIGKIAKHYKNKKERIYAPCYILNTKFPNRVFRLLRSRLKIKHMKLINTLMINRRFL